MSKICINCGNQTEEESKYCHVCGAKISDVVEDSKAQSVDPVLVEEILDDTKVKKGIKKFFIMRNIIIVSVGVVLLAAGLVGSHILREQKIEAVFNTSKEVFNHKDYDKAKVKFNEFLVDYPKAKQADEVKSLLKATQVDIDKIIADKKVEEERIVAEKIEAAKVEGIRVEVARAKADKIKTDQLAADIKEAARVEANRIEVNRVETEKAEANRIEANRLALAKSEGVRLGMSYQQVIESNWGRPKSIESLNSYGNIIEYWYYTGTNYLTFTNAHLTYIYSW